jgi:hypothetical protein
MALRDQIRERVQPFLAPGEQIQAVIPAQTANPYLILISFWLIYLRNPYRVVVATDRRILVFRSGRSGVKNVKEILAEHPRSTLIGPGKGFWYKTDALGERLYIHKRFHSDLAASDAGASAVLPTS